MREKLAAGFLIVLVGAASCRVSYDLFPEGTSSGTAGAAAGQGESFGGSAGAPLGGSANVAGAVQAGSAANLAGEGGAAEPNPGQGGTGSLYIESGSFIGDATPNRLVATLPFTPGFALFRTETNRAGATFKTDAMQGDQGARLWAFGGLGSNTITFDGNDLLVGSEEGVNQGGVTIHWVAVAQRAGYLNTGTYTGDAQDVSISGFGFNPGFVLLQEPVSGDYWLRSTSMSAALASAGDPSDTALLLEADGFRVGAGTTANNLGETHYYVAFREADNWLAQGSYAGTGTPQTIDGWPLSADSVLARCENTSITAWRPITAAGATSFRFNRTHPLTDAIVSLLGGGMNIATAAEVNETGGTCYYVALGH